MLRFPVARWLAFCWGFATLFPIGLNYTAFFLLALALAADRGAWRERWERLRATPNWWPLWAFLLWGVLILVFGAHYPETPSNAWHALRIVLVLWVVLALAREEAAWALRGFGSGLSAAVLIVLTNELWALPPFVLWDSLLTYGGNKAVANALLMALGAVTLALCLPVLAGWRRSAALACLLGLLATLAWVMPSRTAWLIVVVAGAAGLWHQVRSTRQYRGALVMAAVLLLAGGVALQQSPIAERMQAGMQQAIDDNRSQDAEEAGSIGIRYRMYRETAEMIRERPFTGWGIGAWNQKWRERVPASFADLNMPHNDFLWSGSQMGIPGLLALLWLVAAGLPRAWRRRDLAGRLGAVALIAMLIALTTSSALRDATIGMSLWFVVLVYQRLSLDWPSLWDEVLASGQGSPRVAVT